MSKLEVMTNQSQHNPHTSFRSVCILYSVYVYHTIAFLSIMLLGIIRKKTAINHMQTSNQSGILPQSSSLVILLSRIFSPCSSILRRRPRCHGSDYNKESRYRAEPSHSNPINNRQTSRRSCRRERIADDVVAGHHFGTSRLHDV